jgi:hypothetical protein
MIGQFTTQPAIESWREAIALLAEAATRGFTEAEANPALYSTALWADLLASSAIELLPADQDHLLGEVVLDQSCVDLDMVGLIRAAEAATRRHPIEQFPVGASGVIVGLLDLVRESRP